MDWASVAKKNKDKKQEKIKNEKIVEKTVFNPYSILNFKDVDEEFEFKYLRNMTEISIKFQDYIYKNYLPFMDKVSLNIKYTIYDFIKNNSAEYNDTIKKVENYNNDLIKEYEKEQEEIEKELAEEDYISD